MSRRSTGSSVAARLARARLSAEATSAFLDGPGGRERDGRDGNENGRGMETGRKREGKRNTGEMKTGTEKIIEMEGGTGKGTEMERGRGTGRNGAGTERERSRKLNGTYANRTGNRNGNGAGVA